MPYNTWSTVQPIFTTCCSLPYEVPVKIDELPSLLAGDAELL